MPTPSTPSLSRLPSLPVLAAGGLLVAVIGVGVLSSSGEGSDATGVPTSEPVSVTTIDPATTSTTTDVAPSTTTGPAVAPLSGTVAKGAHGEDVKRVQQRLTDLGFQPGPVDGSFGGGTQQAVWAFKKLAGDVNWKDFAARDDQTAVTEEVWQQMNDPAFAVAPRRPGSGTHVEIYLPLQVLAVFKDDQPIFVTHISSGELNPDGTPATFCEEVTYTTNIRGEPLDEPETKAICAEAKTPGGVFRFHRNEVGQHQSALGGMKNPWYFNYGIAIHGAYNVPDYPASHGCVRMSNSLADVFPTLVSKGNAVYVWGLDGKEPEHYTEKESLPSFNRPDPNATTTTTSTTTTMPTTTLAPTTTAAPATTAAPTTVAPTTAAPTTVAPTTVAPTVPTTTVAPPS